MTVCALTSLARPASFTSDFILPPRLGLWRRRPVPPVWRPNNASLRRR